MERTETQISIHDLLDNNKFASIISKEQRELAVKVMLKENWDIGVFGGMGCFLYGEGAITWN